MKTDNPGLDVGAGNSLSPQTRANVVAFTVEVPLWTTARTTTTRGQVMSRKQELYGRNTEEEEQWSRTCV
jgi:hypothetical protein